MEMVYQSVCPLYQESFVRYKSERMVFSDRDSQFIDPSTEYGVTSKFRYLLSLYVPLDNSY